MLFNTGPFFAFFAIVFALYHLLSRRWQNPLLLLASYVFYGWWDWRFLSLLAISTVVDFTVARAMPGAEGRRRRLLLLTSLCVNLGILGFFKYAGFFADSAAGALRAIGLEADFFTLEVLLPVGISFYTFQTMAYTIDVYRRRVEPTDDLLSFAIYVAFFPQLVAGPIERAQRLLPQIRGVRRVDAKTLSSGAVLVLVGLLRKVVLADGVAAIVNRTFADPGAHTSLELLQGVFFFGVQIYGDFSGYSSIARGVARMLGIELMVNFRHPYLARNITDFWRRWHVSLSEWLRDYLYIPLGGSRCSSLLTYRNLMITMLLGGLWHGAAWTFVVWGGLHGLGLAVHKLFRGREGAKRLDRPQGVGGYVGLAASWALTMGFVWLAWIFFRAETFTGAAEVIEGMFALRGPLEQKLLFDMAVATAVLLLIDIPQFVADEHTVFLRWPVPVRGAFYAFCTLAIVVYWSGGATPFIYFQF